jgi:hypothetical protein
VQLIASLFPPSPFIRWDRILCRERADVSLFLLLLLFVPIYQSGSITLTPQPLQSSTRETVQECDYMLSPNTTAG